MFTEPKGTSTFLRGWSNTGTGFQERWLMPHTCQCLTYIWTVPSIISFNFWSALKWSGSWIIIVGHFQLELRYSISIH